MERLKKYLDQGLGDFYTHGANRLMLYPFFFTFFLIECTTFWLIHMGTGFVAEYLAFVTVYTLHKAAVYAICISLADMLVNRLVPAWGTYAKRTVGRQWLIWSAGLAAGFILQRTMVRRLVPVYAPDVVAYFVAHPQARLSTLTLLVVLIPYWVIVLFFTLRVAQSKQRIRQLADALIVTPENRHVEELPGSTTVKPLPVGILKLDSTDGNGAIALSDITHVTVEDHYCRVNYASDEGLKSEMIRLPLKEMLRKLPDDHFLHIHRSHVVNREYISGLAKSGRDHKVILRDGETELPVSRSRFKTLHPAFKLTGLS